MFEKKERIDRKEWMKFMRKEREGNKRGKKVYETIIWKEGNEKRKKSR